MGYALVTAVNGGRLRLPAGASTGESMECWRQLERCRSVLRPNQTMNFYVEAKDGHDDHVISLALLVDGGIGRGAAPCPRPHRDD